MTTGFCQDNDFELEGDRAVENWLVAEINKVAGFKRERAGYYESRSEAEYVKSCMKDKNLVVMSLTDYNRLRLKEKD